MLKKRSLLAAVCGVLAASAPIAAMGQAAVPMSYQWSQGGYVYTDVYGYLDPSTCVVFMAPELVASNYRSWYERWVLVPTGHYEPFAASLAASLSVGGVTGWRIPSLAEAESYKKVQPYLHTSTLNNGYWSTSTLGTQVQIWRVAGNTTRASRSGVFAYLWPVHDVPNCAPTPAGTN